MEKHIIQKVTRLFPSSLSSCHFKNIHPDVVNNSILISKNTHKIHSDHHKSTNLSDSFKSKSKRHAKPTKMSSSSNQSGWFSTDDDYEDEDEHEKEYKEVIAPKQKTETIDTISSSISSNDFRKSISTYKKGEVNGRSFNSIMGCSDPAFISKNSNVLNTSSRMSSASSCNLYYTDLGSFRKETIVPHRKKGDNTLCYHRNISENPIYNSKKSSQQTDYSSGVSSVSSRRVCRKTSRKTSKRRQPRSKKLINDTDGSSIMSANIYYSDLGSFRQPETASFRRETRKKNRGIKWKCGKVEESYAVEKMSNDPYSDFRLSMVEMIIEKQIYGEDELEMLLEKFLSLNSCYHHDIIFKVFVDICKVLFSE